jgi:CheY-like chemotaxis protein
MMTVPRGLIALESVKDPRYNLMLNSGREAYAQVLAHDAVILMDVQMPGMDGFETTSSHQTAGSDRKTFPLLF